MTRLTGPIGKLVSYTGPELATQETIYGFVMSLIFIASAQIGFIKFSSPWDIVILILGMNFVWGTIDMYVFFRMDVTAHRRYVEILSGEGCCNTSEHFAKVHDALDGTILDAVTEEAKAKLVDMILQSEVGSKEEIRTSRRNMLKSAVACFVITMLTTVPLVLCLLLVDDLHLALLAAAVAASLCLFVTGFYLEPQGRLRRKAATGVSMTVLALALTYFAAYFGG
ncbi:MAG: hypothetical protein LBT41_03505 [Candidatus Methanoplasma sp.]|jgi:hypothetical protein|nr:hypothetical protein [Candidatus Methanoplasma sp.]